MGRFPGRQRKGRLPDLGVYPVEDCYAPPPDENAETIPYEVQLAPGHKAGVVQTFRADTTVLMAFSVWQSLYIDGGWKSVMRIDTWHGTVHRHDFTRAGDSKVTILEVIPTDRPERLIERWCDRAEGIMMAEWEDNVRRWHGD